MEFSKLQAALISTARFKVVLILWWMPACLLSFMKHINIIIQGKFSFKVSLETVKLDILLLRQHLRKDLGLLFSSVQSLLFVLLVKIFCQWAERDSRHSGARKPCWKIVEKVFEGVGKGLNQGTDNECLSVKVLD